MRGASGGYIMDDLQWGKDAMIHFVHSHLTEIRTQGVHVHFVGLHQIREHACSEGEEEVTGNNENKVFCAMYTVYECVSTHRCHHCE